MFHVAKFELLMAGAGLFRRHTQHPLAFRRDVVDAPEPVIGVERTLSAAAIALPEAHLEQPLGRALHINEAIAIMVVVQRRHEAVL